MRYQECPWYTRLWRRVRHQWRVPFDAISIWWHDQKRGPQLWKAGDTGEEIWIKPMSFANAWSVALGLSHMDMDWTLTWEEAFGSEGDQ